MTLFTLNTHVPCRVGSRDQIVPDVALASFNKKMLVTLFLIELSPPIPFPFPPTMIVPVHCPIMTICFGAS